MKLLLAFLLSQLLSDTVYSQVFIFEKKHRTHLDAANLKGKVKHLKEIVYKGTAHRNDSTTHPAVNWYFLIDYNQHGNMIQKKQMRADHSLARLENYYYNERQQLVRQVGRYEDPSSEEVTTFHYDRQGNRISEVVTMFKGTVVIVTRDFKFDSRKRTTEMVIRYPTQNQVDRRAYRYDARDEMVEHLIYGKTKTVRYVYKHSDSGTVLTYFWSYLNNTKPVGKPTVTINKYDENKNLLYSVYDKGETGSPEYLNTYDLDKYGNWIRKFASKPGEARTKTLIESREIEYWE